MTKQPADTVIGYDTSTDMHTLSVLCADCGDPSDGPALYVGDEWGCYLDSHCCEACGRDLSLDGLELIPHAW